VILVVAALVLAVNVLLLTVQVQRLTKERDAALQALMDAAAARIDSDNAIRRAALDRIRASVQPVTSWSQPGSRQAN
jgi:hypothetical protein